MKVKTLTLSLGSAGLLLPFSALAVCPVCTVTVGAGLGVSRWLGVDDLITSVWIGGLTFSVSIWTINWLFKRNWRFPLLRTIVLAGYYVLVFASLKWSDAFGHGTIWNVDKVVFGAVAGSFVFAAATWLSGWIKGRNGGKVMFPYQRVVLPFVGLVAASAIFYFLTK